MQEFLAGNHVTKMEDAERIALLNKSKNDKTKWKMVIVFLCGLLKRKDQELDKLYSQVVCKDLEGRIFKRNWELKVQKLRTIVHLVIDIGYMIS